MRGPPFREYDLIYYVTRIYPILFLRNSVIRKVRAKEEF